MSDLSGQLLRNAWLIVVVKKKKGRDPNIAPSSRETTPPRWPTLPPSKRAKVEASQTTKKKKADNVVSPGLEPGTFSVLARNHDQLDHETR